MDWRGKGIRVWREKEKRKENFWQKKDRSKEYDAVLLGGEAETEPLGNERKDGGPGGRSVGKPSQGSGRGQRLGEGNERMPTRGVRLPTTKKTRARPLPLGKGSQNTVDSSWANRKRDWV